jgi:hypothetical protein
VVVPPSNPTTDPSDWMLTSGTRWKIEPNGSDPIRRAQRNGRARSCCPSVVKKRYDPSPVELPGAGLHILPASLLGRARRFRAGWPSALLLPLIRPSTRTASTTVARILGTDDQARPVRSRCAHPGQQQGRRMPSSSSSRVRRMRRSRVLSCLASSTQQMNSLRASGVMSFQASSAAGFVINSFRRSPGSLWTTPPGSRGLVTRPE